MGNPPSLHVPKFMSFKSQFDSPFMHNSIKGDFSRNQIRSKSSPLSELVDIPCSRSGISQFKSRLGRIEQYFTKTVSDVPDITLCSDLSGTRSGVNVFPDQKSGLGTEVKAMDRAIKSYNLHVIAIDILYHTRLVS